MSFKCFTFYNDSINPSKKNEKKKKNFERKKIEISETNLKNDKNSENYKLKAFLSFMVTNKQRRREARGNRLGPWSPPFSKKYFLWSKNKIKNNIGPPK